jgi:transcriptional regulator with XRE-family HTH domain
MKQVKLAQQLGISKSYLSMILSGKRTPNQELAQRLSSLEVHKSEPISPCKGGALPAELQPHV